MKEKGGCYNLLKNNQGNRGREKGIALAKDREMKEFKETFRQAKAARGQSAAVQKQVRQRQQYFQMNSCLCNVSNGMCFFVRFREPDMHKRGMVGTI